MKLFLVRLVMDKRQLKTIKNIDRTIFSLLQTQSFNNLTVRQIAEAAEIGRSTFYQYYFDKYDWLKQKNDEYFAIFEAKLNTRFDATHIAESLDILINNLWDERASFLVLLNIKDGKATLTHQFQNALFNQAKTLLKYSQMDQIQLDYFSNLYAQISLNHIKWSLQNGLHSNIDKTLDQILQDFLKNH